MKFMPNLQSGVNKVATVPAPTGGLNVRDSLANMAETDAISLINWWPEPRGLSVRKGSRLWHNDVPDGSGALAVWSSGTEDKLFAVGSDGAGGWALYDVTTRQTTADPAPTFAIDGVLDKYIQTIQTVNDAGVHLFIVNAAGCAIVYSNDGFHAITYDHGAPPSTPAAYTWYTPTDVVFAQLTSHQGHLWGTSNSSVGYYLPVDALYGTWNQFDFGPQFTLGGTLAFITTWTIDDGNGAEDHLVAVSTEGQAAVYGGTDPADISSWSLVGVYTIGVPVGDRRSFVKVGGDLLILTQQGLVSMAAMLVSTRVNGPVTAVNSDKIKSLISDAANIAPTSYSWQLFYYATDNLFMINTPGTARSEGTPWVAQKQLAVNLVTTANPWTTFVDIPAKSWVVFKDRPFFATADGKVYEGWYGYFDGLDLEDKNGVGVKSQVQQAYSYFNTPAVQKQVGMYRPGFLVLEDITFGAVIEYDFVVRRLRIPGESATDRDLALWDAATALWDSAVWSGGIYPDRRWIQGEGVGTAVSLRMSMQTASKLLWVATDYSYKVGGLL